MTVETRLEPANVNVRIKIAALWTSMLFVFAYVDIFSLYRPDFRAALEAGEIAGFTVNQSFLAGTTAYVVIPVYYAWTWPKETPPTSTTVRAAPIASSGSR